MRGLFHQGAFQQSEKRAESDSFFVICDEHRQPAVRDRPRPGQRRRRLRTAQAGRVRRHHDHPDLQLEAEMAQFTVNATRFDPYKAFMFRVKWDGKYVAGVSKMSALKRSTDPVLHRDGGDPSPRAQEPGQDQVRGGHARAWRHPRPDVRGCGRTSSTRWRSPISLKNFRKDVDGGRVQRGRTSWSSRTSCFRCWPSEFQSLPALDAGTVGVAIETHQARARGLGARHRGHRTGRAVARMGVSALLAALDDAGSEVGQAVALLRCRGRGGSAAAQPRRG